jgi:hypothetical protein
MGSMVDAVLQFLHLHGGTLASDQRVLPCYAELVLGPRRVLLSFDPVTGKCCYRVMGGDRELWGECASVEGALAAIA